LSISVRSRAVLYGLLAVAAVAGIWLTRLSLFTLIASFLAFVALPRAGRKVPLTLVAVAAAASVLGFVRFLVREAVPGIVQGGTFATQDAAVSRLRELLFAEDSLRRFASIDPDGDRIGSAAFIDEMTGRTGLRGGGLLSPPVLERYPASQPTALGPAVEINGYLFVICLPQRGGGWTANPSDAVDDEAAERRFLAYAWPASSDRGLVLAYFLDEHERILFAPNGAPRGDRPRTGPDRPPRCDDAISPETREQWQVWRNKHPRDRLPGDR
jgi:hypothetical protein